MKPLCLGLPGNDALADGLAKQLDADLGRLAMRRFPDGESYAIDVGDLLARGVRTLISADG